MPTSGDAPAETRTKVAVLGGGAASLAAVFALTSPDNPRHREYEVTVYQLGWRLGGKGASGRNMRPGYGRRIEEHGIHLLMGCYENTFAMIRDCYAARPPGSAFATWRDAFKPIDVLVLMEQYQGRWQPWPIETPTNADEPGSGGLFPGTLTLLLEIFIGWPVELLRTILNARDAAVIERGGLHATLVRGRQLVFGWLGHPLGRARRALDTVLRQAVSSRAGADERRRALLRAARWFGRSVARELAALDVDHGLAMVLGHLQRFVWGIVRHHLDDTAVRRAWILFNFAVGNLRGILEDGVVHRGLDSLNDRDYRAWLGPRLLADGPDGRLTLDSGFGFFLYEAGFAYQDGDAKRPSFEAGNALRILIRLFLTFKGTLAFKMQAGMGDVIFAPLYQVLKARGVKFEFFHRVVDVTPDASGGAVDAITLERQARLAVPGAAYDPLIEVKGLPCWPAEPRYEQLDPRDRQRPPELFESYGPVDPARTFTIHRAGRGDPHDPGTFDQVILGISAGGLRCVAPAIIAAKPDWQRMLAALGTVRTQAFQLWLTASLSELGWPAPRPAPPVAAGYRESPAMAIYADMADVLSREDWPADGPRDVGYFCGALAKQPGDDTDWCRQGDAREAARAHAFHATSGLMAPYWPKAVEPSGELDWRRLFDGRAKPGTGAARFDSQYWVGTANPSDRYVQTLTGSSRHRLRAGQAGLGNLVLAGDWIDSTFNVGCVEAAVMAGLSAANAVCGYPRLQDIVGWGFGEPSAGGSGGSETP